MPRSCIEAAHSSVVSSSVLVGRCRHREALDAARIGKQAAPRAGQTENGPLANAPRDHVGELVRDDRVRNKLLAGRTPRGAQGLAM